MPAMTGATAEQFATPKGAVVSMLVRPGTNDADMCRSAMTEDEYGLKALDLTGWCLDIGAHIGQVAVAILADHPDAQVIAVEPVQENYDLLLANLSGFPADRWQIRLGAACAEGQATVQIAVKFSGNESADRHTWIANQPMAEGTEQEVRTVRGFAASAFRFYRPTFGVIDCEGCEYDFLNSPSARQVDRWHGEYHHGLGPLVDLFPGHDLALAGDPGVGVFRVVRK